MSDEMIELLVKQSKERAEAHAAESLGRIKEFFADKPDSEDVWVFLYVELMKAYGRGAEQAATAIDLHSRELKRRENEQENDDE